MHAQLDIMAGQGISRALFSFSTPGPNVYPGNKILTVALARLMNEQAAGVLPRAPRHVQLLCAGALSVWRILQR